MSKIVTSVLTLALCSVPAGAETLDPIVVTPTRAPEPLSSTLESVVVIEREDIERSQAKDVAELLRFHAGIEIARAGGPGQQTSVFIRGTNSNQTLILIDGIPINPGTIGNAALQNISPEMVERIEVVMGPRSTLYGSEAIGGVINIITRGQAPATGSRWSGTASAGGNNTLEGAATYQFASQDLRLAADLDYLESDGYPPHRDSDTDRGHRDLNLNALVGGRLGGVDVQLSHWQSQGHTGYLDFFLTPLDQDFLSSVSSLQASATPTDAWESTLKLSYFRDRIDQNQGSDFAHTARYRLDWQNDLRLGGGHLLTLGAAYKREHTDSLVFGEGYDEVVHNLDAYVQDDLHAGAHRLTLGASLVHNELFGDHGTWSTAYGYELSTATRFFASAATGFRAPDSTDLFGFGGNPDLDPERSLGLEAGLRHQLTQAQQLSLSLFYTRIKDLIQFVDPDGFLGPEPGTNENIGRARIQGVELGYELALGPVQLGLNGVLQNPENEDTGETLPRRARKSLTTNLTYRLGRTTLRLDLLASGKRNDSEFSQETLPGYTVVDAAVGYRLDRGWTLEARVENLFDKDYEMAKDFPAQDRIAYLGVRFAAGAED